MSVRCVSRILPRPQLVRLSVSRVPSSSRSPSAPSLTARPRPHDAARVSSRRVAIRAQVAATLAKLKSLWVNGEVGPDTPVWTEGMPERTRVRDVPPLLGCLPGASLASPRAALLSDDHRWESGGYRHRAAAAAAAAGECSPALVLDLLRELKATQRVCAEQRAAIDSLQSQRRLLMDDKRRARRDEDEAAREIALAEAEMEARDLVRELRALAVEARAERARRIEDDGERRGRRARDRVFFRDRGRRGDAARRADAGSAAAGVISSPAVGATATALDGADGDARRAPKTLREKNAHVRDEASSVSADAPGRSAELVDELARGVSAGVLKGAPPLRRVRGVAERTVAGGVPRTISARRAFAFFAYDLCGKRLWIAPDGAGAALLVLVGGGVLDLEAWLRRNRFWERGHGEKAETRDGRRERDRGSRLTEW